jgi:hypothetical protein
MSRKGEAESTSKLQSQSWPMERISLEANASTSTKALESAVCGQPIRDRSKQSQSLTAFIKAEFAD